MAAKQKVVLLLGLHENDAREKRKVLKAVSTFPGLDLIAVDMKQHKLTVVGLVDPIELVTKLRKLWHADILFVGPAKEDKISQEEEEEVTAKQVERHADMRSWPQAAVYVYPPRPRHPPYPYHDGVQPQEDPSNSYVAYGGLGAQENNHPSSYYVAGGLGAHENTPYSYAAHAGHGARENPPNACAIC